MIPKEQKDLAKENWLLKSTKKVQEKKLKRALKDNDELRTLNKIKDHKIDSVFNMVKLMEPDDSFRVAIEKLLK